MILVNHSTVEQNDLNAKSRKEYVESGVEKLAQTKTYLVDPVAKLYGESHDSLKKAAASQYKLKRGLGGFIVTPQETHLCSSSTACQELQVSVLFVPKSQ
jgi:hypothetical protein